MNFNHIFPGVTMRRMHGHHENLIENLLVRLISDGTITHLMTGELGTVRMFAVLRVCHMRIKQFAED